MEIGFLSRSLSRDAGGIFEIETALAKELAKLGTIVKAYGATDRFTSDDKIAWGDIETISHGFVGVDSYRYSIKLCRDFLNYEPDICHLHSLWSHTSYIATRWGKIKKRPVVVSPNGMLDPWALSHSAWKKKIVLLLQERKLLHHASCIQANTEKEANDIRSLGLKCPIAIIPNGVYLPNLSNSIMERFNRREEPRTLLYLGRLHPKKGIANAIYAWAHFAEKFRKDGWQFIIAGWDQNGHLGELKKLCIQLNLRFNVSEGEVGERLGNDIIFLGARYGQAKENLFSKADAFILPSYSEGMPMSILEAWSYRVPTLMTSHCNLDVGVKYGAAFGIMPTVQSIEEGFRFLLSVNQNDLLSMGESARRLVESQFTWRSVASKMQVLYRWLLEGATSPDFLVE